MKRFLGTALLILAFAWPASASGPFYYVTRFVDQIERDDVIAGNFPYQLRSYDVVFPLIIYLQLNGRFTDHHATLFQSKYTPPARAEDYEKQFWLMAREEGYEPPMGFGTRKLFSRVITDPANPGNSRTTSHYVHNCQHDAFKTAWETLSDRKSQYGPGSVELSRWLEAQVQVFAQCSGETAFVPLEEPASNWLPLEQHDRRYQIAAAYFYDGQYLEAVSRFEDIGRNADSPWQDLGRYLVGRALAREATVNGNDPLRHLNLSLNAYQELANEPEYLAAFPSVPGQIIRIRTRIDSAAVQSEIEQRIFDDPASMSAQDLFNYDYLRRRASPTEEATDYTRWVWYATNYQTTPEEVVEQWRVEQSTAWLYIALARASSSLGESTLAELLLAAEALPDDTPGHLNILVQRIRILGLLGRVDAGLQLAEEAIGKGLDRSSVNRVRLAAAGITLTGSDFFRWASLKPLSLPWTDDFARQLPPNFHRITRDTTLFSNGAIDLLNTYFTSSMIEEVIDTPGLSDFQRGRLAIAGWTKAMLADDLESALRLSVLIRRHVPWLARELERFEQAQDKHFEAARIIFDYPAFSPWLDRGVARLHFDSAISHDRQTPDHVTFGGGWWCSSLYGNQTSDEVLQSPLFSRYSDAELSASREVGEYRQTAATTSFGPHVIRYASDNLDDPRVPRTLHRLVFATRIACYSPNAPGNLSQAAFALLHEHFPDSEWAERTPYWYGRLD